MNSRIRADVAAPTGAGGTPAGTNHLAQVFAQFPIEVAHGEGVWLHTRDGRKILDFYGGHAVAGLGYGHPRWVAALERQARQMSFQTNALPLAVRARAAARLVKFANLGLDTVFFINSGAEANENALKLAFKMTGRSKAVALQHGWHGRTAAAAAVTWGALEKWYGFPNRPFDVAFAPRNDPAALEQHIDRHTAVVIVEPIQGLGGAYDVGKPMLDALRERCDRVGALLVFDEVQCGVGRTGAPFAANYHGVTPDMLTCAKALGNGFPVSALMLSPKVAAQIQYDDMGTTFGGGPMACAAVEAVIEAMEAESLLANVRQVSAYIRAHCLIGPVTGVQGAGFLLGLRTSRPAKEVQAALLERGILAGTSADPQVLRLLPAYILNEGHVDILRDALAKIPGVKRFLDLADFDRAEILDLLALAQSLADRPPGPVLAGKVLGLVFLNPSLRTLASFQAAMGRLGGTSFVITPGQGTWQLETRPNAVMDGAAAEHIREGIPVLASYCDALGVRVFAEGKSLREDLDERVFRAVDALCESPLINLESAMNHPCQALADWRTLDELRVPQRGKFVLSWSYHPRALPLAVPSAIVHMAAMRGMEVVVARPEGFALPSEVMDKARLAARAAGGSVTETADRSAALKGAHVVYAKEWGSTAHYGDAPADASARAGCKDWCVSEDWFAEAAPRAPLMHCLPVRRNVSVADEALDGPRSAVKLEARNRLTVQTAVLYRMLADFGHIKSGVSR